jgi:hypothetical protein
VVEHKNAGKSPDTETRKMKEDKVQTAAIEAAKLAQTIEAAKLRLQQSNDTKQQQGK